MDPGPNLATTYLSTWKRKFISRCSKIDFCLGSNFSYSAFVLACDLNWTSQITVYLKYSIRNCPKRFSRPKFVFKFVTEIESLILKGPLKHHHKTMCTQVSFILYLNVYCVFEYLAGVSKILKIFKFLEKILIFIRHLSIFYKTKPFRNFSNAM